MVQAQPQKDSMGKEEWVRISQLLLCPSLLQYLRMYSVPLNLCPNTTHKSGARVSHLRLSKAVFKKFADKLFSNEQAAALARLGTPPLKHETTILHTLSSLLNPPIYTYIVVTLSPINNEWTYTSALNSQLYEMTSG